MGGKKNASICKRFFRRKNKKRKRNQGKKEHEKDKIAGKLNTITEYNHLKKQIHYIKIWIGAIGFELFIMTCLLLSCGIMIAMFDLAVVAIFFPIKFLMLEKCKKEFKKFSQEEVNELRENEENMKELYKKLEKEITSSQRSIDQYEKELGEISIVEKFKDSNSMNQPFYQADTEKEYNQLLNAQIKPEITLNEFLNEKRNCKTAFDAFLNEKANYENIHLEVQEVDCKAKCLIKK